MSQDDIQTAELEQAVNPIHKVRIRKRRQGMLEKHAMILDQTAKGLKPKVIAQEIGERDDYVREVIRKFKPVFKELENVPNYRSVKSDLLAAGQLVALKSAMSESKLKKASFASTLAGFEILNKAERLENNQTTENVGNNFITNNVQINVHENSNSREINGANNPANEQDLLAIDDAEILLDVDIDNTDKDTSS